MPWSVSWGGAGGVVCELGRGLGVVRELGAGQGRGLSAGVRARPGRQGPGSFQNVRP